MALAGTARGLLLCLLEDGKHAAAHDGEPYLQAVKNGALEVYDLTDLAASLPEGSIQFVQSDE